MKAKSTLLLISLLLPFSSTMAGDLWMQWTSDYLFNGVSQRDHRAALQWSYWQPMANDTAITLFNSSVDFGDGTEQEVDLVLSWYSDHPIWHEFKLVESGAARYQYFGAPDSSALSFTEWYQKFKWQDWEFNYWFAPDYFGFGGGHLIGQVATSFTLTEHSRLRAGVTYSHSFAPSKWNWEGKHGFHQWLIDYQWQTEALQFNTGYSVTSLDEPWGENTLYLNVSHTWSF